MQLSPVPRDIAHAGLRAAKTVCLSAGIDELSPLQSQFLEAVQQHLLGTDFNLDDLAAISPSELSRSVETDELKKRIIWACILAAAIDGTLEEVEVEQVEQYAKALGVDLAPVQTAWKLAKRQTVLARIDIVRKSMVGVKVKDVFQTGGSFAVLKQFLPLAGVDLPAVTERYRQLWDFPRDTLGREFADYIDRNRFPLPGQVGAGPEIIVVHDCLHILGDYGTTASAEIEVASFQAGCHSQDPFHGLLFGLAQYHLGVQVAPVAASQKMQADPAKVVAAFARGCRVRRDMWTDFDPWKFFHRDIGDLRREFGIGPKPL